MKQAAARAFKNSRGQVVDPPSFSATAAKNSFGALLDGVAARGIVTITKRDRVRAVLLSVDEYDALQARVPDPVERLRSEFDTLVAAMQTPRANKAAKGLFDATPAQLGRAAVKAARRG